MAWHRSPLIYPAGVLSAASLVWTTWSLVDLLGAGPVGITVAAGADIIWASVLVADARGLRVNGRRWIVPFFGWVALLAVACFLTWHGISLGNAAMAVAGPFLPLGAKAIWMLAIADMRDPSALTDDELAALAVMERGMVFEEKQHRIEMRRREMGAELQIAEVGTDFRIEIMRQDKARALQRQRPLEIPPTLRDATPGHGARHDTATGQDETPGHDTATRRDALPLVPPRPAVPPSAKPLVQPAPITAATEQQDPVEPAHPNPPRPARPGQPSIRDTVLAALNEGIPETDDQALRARVEEVHGPIREKAADGEVKAGSYRKGRARAIDAWHKRTGEGQYA